MSQQLSVPAQVKEQVKRLPKVELHLHLEGSVTPPMFLELSRKYGTQYQSASEEEIRTRFFEYDDFEDFLNTYRVVCEHLREASDYLRLLEGLGQYFSEQNIRYAEIIYAPSIAWKFERDGKEILLALLEKSSSIEAAGGTIIRWILDCVRTFGPGPAQRTAELAAALSDRGVVGVGLGGDEESLPANTYAETFSWARAHQLFAHVHAGEIGNPQNVWDALLILGANRIGHGIQAARDASLMAYLHEHAIGLDVCLTSNWKTGAWSPISDNPFPVLLEKGVPVSLNTDDPGLFQTTLTDEFEKAIHFFSLSQDDVHRIILQGVRSSFLPHDQKMVLMESFQEEMQAFKT